MTPGRGGGGQTGGGATAGQGRDRDDVGRPRNARPRDGLGRPLPRTASSDVSRIPDDLRVSPAEAAALGQSLLAEGRPFHAHEVFEAAWKTGPSAERDLWQGLAQIAVGVTHARRGNASGAITLLRRGAARIRDYANGPRKRAEPAHGHAEHPGAAAPGEPARYGIDIGFAAGIAEDVAARIERDGLPSVPEADLLLPLCPPPPLSPPPGNDGGHG
jgi:hypothetical protein